MLVIIYCTHYLFLPLIHVVCPNHTLATYGLGPKLSTATDGAFLLLNTTKQVNTVDVHDVFTQTFLPELIEAQIQSSCKLAVRLSKKVGDVFRVLSNV